MSEQPSNAPKTEFVFEAKVECEMPRVVGPSKYGQHQLVPIVGGSFEGPRLKGQVLPGGADWQRIRADGVMEIEARYTLRTDDGWMISVCNRGIGNMNPESFSASDPPGPYVRTVPEFEAAGNGPYAWLNKWVFVGTLHVLSYAPLIVRIGVFRLI